MVRRSCMGGVSSHDNSSFSVERSGVIEHVEDSPDIDIFFEKIENMCDVLSPALEIIECILFRSRTCRFMRIGPSLPRSSESNHIHRVPLVNRKGKNMCI